MSHHRQHKHDKKTMAFAHPQMNPAERDAMLLELQQLEAYMSQAKLRVEYLKKTLVAGLFPQKKYGTQRFELGRGYNVKAVVQQRIKINKNEADDFSHLREMVDKMPPDIQSTLLKWTPEISGTVYRSLPDDLQKIVNEICTVSEYVSELEIEAPKQPTL